MTPLPVEHATSDKPSGEGNPMPATPPDPYSAATRRPSSNPVPRAYPWLLCTSTAIAALFCLLYLTKPVILPSAAPAAPFIPVAPAAPAKPPLVRPGDTVTQTGLLPNAHRLPGELSPPATATKPTGPRHALSSPPATSAFEETNLRIQHVLTAEAPGGHLARIDLDVPVLYQSRRLRWTPADVAAARGLLVRLMDYQEKSRQLRAEGGELLDGWNRLIEHSLPAADLRADSPSLPANQQDAADAPRAAGLITTESIQIQPAGK